MKKIKQQNGITLVALVITIIVLLILAGISIQAITNTGLFAQAENAKRESEIANIKEQIALDIYEKQLEPPVGSITEEQLETILGKYGTVNKEDGTIVGITTAKGYEILLKDIYGGETVAETVPESVPDGAIVTPVNDITTWLKTVGISKQYSYTTIEQVIADSTCTKSLMNNENAMKYLARSTEFANAICASETAMTSLGQSAYVDDTVLNSDLWVNTIKSSQYWALVYAYKTVTIYGAATETIKIEGFYGSFMTGTDGSCSHVVPLGEITLTGSVSEQSFTRMVTNDTTEVRVMPDDALYWYGNECTWITGGWVKSHMYNRTGYSQSNAVTKYSNRIHLYANSENDTSYIVNMYGCVTTNNKIDVSKYNKVSAVVDYKVYSKACAGCMFFSVCSTKYISSNADDRYVQLSLTENLTTIGKTTIHKEYSSSNSGYITIDAHYAGNGNMYGLWLSK